MYDVVTNNLIIREWLNGSLFPLSANLAFIIFVFLVDSYRERDRSSWWEMDGVPTGCALFWIFLMESVRAGCVWYILRVTNDGFPVPDWMREIANYSFVVAAGALAVTMLRCTYLFTPRRWGNWYWIYSAALTTAFLLASHFIPTQG